MKTSCSRGPDPRSSIGKTRTRPTPLVTLEKLDRWLDSYGRAWERKDIAPFIGCFAEDAVYQRSCGMPQHRRGKRIDG